MPTASHLGQASAFVSRSQIDEARDPIAIVRDGQIIHVNSSFVRLLRAPDSAALVGSSLFEFIHAHDRQHPLARIGSPASPDIAALRQRLLAFDDQSLDVHIACSTLAFDGALAARVVVHDIAAHLEADERLRLLAAATRDVLWDWDVGTGKLWSSDAIAEYGYTPDGLTLDWWVASIAAPDRERVKLALDAVIASTDTTWSQEFRFRRADGTFATVLTRCHIIRDSEQRAVRVLGAMADVSALRRTESERGLLRTALDRAERVNSLGRVAATLAHEFNNVLMAIAPHAEILRRTVISENVSKAVEHIMQAVVRGKRVTQEILEFTRATPPDLRPLNVRRWLARMLDELHSLPFANVDIEASSPVQDVWISADRARFEQAVLNVVINARDAMPDGGTLRISVDRGAAHAHSLPDSVAQSLTCVAIADSGTGMTPETQQRVLEPLFTTKKRGTGLGLAIVQQIMDEHGGYIFIDSLPGRGTTVHLLFERTEDRRISDPGSTPTPRRSLAGTRVLLIEDETAVSAGITAGLTPHEIDVDVITQGRNAERAVERFAPDVVILDIGLPDMDGFEVLSILHDHWPGLPVVISTGHGDRARLMETLDGRRIAFLQKPYEIDVLLDALARLLEVRDTMRQ